MPRAMAATESGGEKARKCGRAATRIGAAPMVAAVGRRSAAATGSVPAKHARFALTATVKKTETWLGDKGQ